MENFLLSAKLLIFFAIELFLLVVTGAALIGALNETVWNKVRESRRQDEIAPETA